MYYMFVDESGNPRVRNNVARDDVYIQSGLIVRDDDVYRARATIDKAKRELFKGKDTAKWELHGYEMWRSKGRFSADLRISNHEKKTALFTRTVEAIGESGAVLVSAIIWKNRLPSRRHDLLKLLWMLTTERFDQYLEKHGNGEQGRIIADASNRGTEAKIKSLLRDMSVQPGRYRGRPTLALNDVGFVDSLSEPLVQAADMAAYIIHRHCHGDVLFRDWFDALAACMWQSDGRLEGFGITTYPAIAVDFGGRGLCPGHQGA